jgi:hypothetical protein
VVPLRDGSYAIGIIARAASSGILFGYFFGKRFGDVPGREKFPDLKAGQAVLVMECSSLGLRNGTWTHVSRDWSWDRAEWPFPWFRHKSSFTGRYTRRLIDETDLATMLREESVSEEEALTLPEDGLAGAEFLEKILSRLILDTAK